jgi:alpha,alpha-trehalase
VDVFASDGRPEHRHDILDRQGGWFRLRPTDVSVTADRRYLAGTMVLETTWDTPTGRAVVRDVLLVGPWRDESPASSVHLRAPSDHQAEGSCSEPRDA